MTVSNTLCNPTPWDVKINWHAGIVIIVPANGEVDLDVSSGQMDDFRDGKPGSEEVRNLMDHYGIFLKDPSRSYESQALRAIQASIRSKNGMYQDHVNSLRRRRAAEGITENPDAFEEILQQSGYAQLREQVTVLKQRAKFLETNVKESSQVVDDLDPERTLLFTDPPKVFPNKLALQMFLNDPGNEALKEQYEKQMAAYNQPEPTPAPTPSFGPTPLGTVDRVD